MVLEWRAFDSGAAHESGVFVMKSASPLTIAIAIVLVITAPAIRRTRKFLIMLAVLQLAGCGVEVAGTAATVAAAKAKEAEEAKKTMDQFKQNLDAARQAQQQATEAAEKEAGK